MSLLNSRLVIDGSTVKRISSYTEAFDDEDIAAIQRVVDDGAFTQEDTPSLYFVKHNLEKAGVLIAVIDGELVHREICFRETLRDFSDVHLSNLGGIVFSIGLNGAWVVKIIDDDRYIPTTPNYIGKILHGLTEDGRTFTVKLDNRQRLYETDRGVAFDELLEEDNGIVVSRRAGVVRVSAGTRVIADIPFDPLTSCLIHNIFLMADEYQLNRYLVHPNGNIVLSWTRLCEVAQIRGTTVLMKDGTIWRAYKGGLTQIDAVSPPTPKFARKPALFCD